MEEQQNCQLKNSGSAGGFIERIKSNCKKCGVAVPLSSSLLKIIKIPAVSEKQLKK